MEPEATSQVKSSRVKSIGAKDKLGRNLVSALLSFAQKLKDEKMSSLLQPNNIFSSFNFTALQPVKDIQVQESKNADICSTMLKDFRQQPQISSKEALVIEIESVGPTTTCQKDVLLSFLNSIFFALPLLALF